MHEVYSRKQRLVVEIGDEGQASIVGATALVLAKGLAGITEARYLAGAGFGLVRTSSHQATRAALEAHPTVVIATDAEESAQPPVALAESLALAIEDPAALAIAVGAARALRQLRVAAHIDLMPVPPRPPANP